MLAQCASTTGTHNINDIEAQTYNVYISAADKKKAVHMPLYRQSKYINKCV